MEVWRVHRDRGFRKGRFEKKPGERMGSRQRSVHSSATQQSPFFLPTEEDSSKPCQRYPLVDIEQSDYLFDPFAVLLHDVDHWEGLSDTTYGWFPRFSAL